MPEQLTACKDCEHGHCLTNPNLESWCNRNNARGRDEKTFLAWDGAFVSGRSLCVQVNIDGHCPHFEAKQ